MYGFDKSDLGKTKGVFELWHVGEKGVSIFICLDWSFVFVDSFF